MVISEINQKEPNWRPSQRLSSGESCKPSSDDYDNWYALAHDIRCIARRSASAYILDLRRAFDIPRWRIFLLSLAAETTLPR